MGFIRGLGKFLGSTLFSTFLVLAILLMEIVSFTTYDNFESLASEIFEKQFFSPLGQQDLSDLKGFLLFQCQNVDRVNVPITGGQPVVLNCSDIRNSDETQMKNLIITALIDSIYYKDFDCSFVECIRTGNPQNLLIAATNEGNLFYKGLQTYMWAGAIIGLVVLLVSSETWTGRLKGVGLNLIFTGLPFLVLGYLQSLLLSSVPIEIEVSLRMMESLISSLRNNFTIVLVIGVILLVAGYALGFYLSRKGKKK